MLTIESASGRVKAIIDEDDAGAVTIAIWGLAPGGFWRPIDRFTRFLPFHVVCYRVHDAIYRVNPPLLRQAIERSM